MSKQFKPSFKEISIKLEPEQRFFYQQDDGSILLVDEIDVFAYAQQLTLSGNLFWVDYEENEIEKANDRGFTTFEMNPISDYSESEG